MTTGSRRRVSRTPTEVRERSGGPAGGRRAGVWPTWSLEAATTAWATVRARLPTVHTGGLPRAPWTAAGVDAAAVCFHSRSSVFSQDQLQTRCNPQSHRPGPSQNSFEMENKFWRCCSITLLCPLCEVEPCRSNVFTRLRMVLPPHLGVRTSPPMELRPNRPRASKRRRPRRLGVHCRRRLNAGLRDWRRNPKSVPMW